MTSSTTRSGLIRSATASASGPSAAVGTSKPANRRLADSSSTDVGLVVHHHDQRLGSSHLLRVTQEAEE